MWSNSELKERAKSALATSYWKALAVSLILTFALSGTRGGNGINYVSNIGNFADGDYSKAATFGIIAVVVIMFVVLSTIALAMKIFIGFPLEVGGRKYFLLAAKARETGEFVPFNVIGAGFKGKVYKNILKTMFFRSLYIFLWSLLLIVPGIICSYKYTFVPYILAENPNISYQRALELSALMTQGEKMDMFILDLSFILWWLLGCITCFIGFIFINPYYNSTYAELYHVLKEKVLTTGEGFAEDFCITVN